MDALPSIRSDPGGSATKASTPFIRLTVSAPRAGISYCCTNSSGRGTSERNRLVSVLAVRALLKKQGLADVSTTTARGRLMLTVLGRLAEFERELIRARTGEGRERR